MGEFDVPVCEGGVANSLPLVLCILFARDGDGLLKVAEGEGEVKAVFGVGGDFECLLLIALAFEEACNLVVLVLWYGGQEFIGGFKVAAEDECLVLDDSKGESERDDVYILVGDVDSAVTWKVAKDVVRRVEM